MESRKKISEGLRKFLGNFTLNLVKVCRKNVEFHNIFRERLRVKTLVKAIPSINHRGLLRTSSKFFLKCPFYSKYFEKFKNPGFVGTRFLSVSFRNSSAIFEMNS